MIREVLKRTLLWIDLALKMDEEFKAAYLDTKANLLYKLGRIKAAILLQEEAVTLDSKNIDMQKALNNMKAEEPTYLEQGALWNARTLPKKKN